LIIRTRGESTPTLAGLLGAPFRIFVFEPAHLIMERGMLLGIKQRSEQSHLDRTLIARRK
jgi:hypothetical protein